VHFVGVVLFNYQFMRGQELYKITILFSRQIVVR